MSPRGAQEQGCTHLAPRARAPRPRTHPHTALSSAAASRLQPRSRATAASSRPASATPRRPGRAGAGGSFSDKSPDPRSRPRHSSPKAPTWKARVFSSGSSYSGKLLPPALDMGSCLPPTQPHVGPPRLLSAMFASLPSLHKPGDQGLAERDGTCSCAWPALASNWAAPPSFRHYVSQQAPRRARPRARPREALSAGLSALFSARGGSGAVAALLSPQPVGLGGRPLWFRSVALGWAGRPGHALRSCCLLSSARGTRLFLDSRVRGLRCCLAAPEPESRGARAEPRDMTGPPEPVPSEPPQRPGCTYIPCALLSAHTTVLVERLLCITVHD